MFDSLKDKLKGWINKIKPAEETKEEIETKSKKAKIVKKSDSILKERKKVKERIVEIEKEGEKKEQEKQGRKQEKQQGKLEEKQEEKKKKKWFWQKEEEKVIDIGEEEKEEKENKFSWDFLSRKLSEEKFDELFSELELELLKNNVASEVVDKIKIDLRNELLGKKLSEVNIEDSLSRSLNNVLRDSPDFIKEIKKTLAVKTPFTIVFLGINGTGKTTTIAKIVNLLKKNKLSCCLAAADTFRAASIEQLEIHANKLQVPLIKKDYGADPASVGFDAVQYAKNHHIDVVLIDSAGRMNTKDSLMKEIEKIVKVVKADMRIFVGESITGNDAIEQAKTFDNSVNLTGIILTKVDVDEKGGTALSISYATKKPILFLGTGQKYEDLEVFEKKRILKNLGF